MTEEIKEILSYLKKKENTRRIKCITTEECKQLLNYITNLQKENELLKEDIENISVSHFSLFKRYDDYKQRNEKATKLLKKASCYDEETKTFCYDVWDELDELLNILQGGDE